MKDKKCTCGENSPDSVVVHRTDGPCYLRPHPTTKSSDWERVAMNIVYQIGDLLYQNLPPDIAHEHFVKARQNTNDRAIDFAQKLIQQSIDTAEEKYLEWFREFGVAMALEGVVLPEELSDVKSVVTSIKRRIDTAVKDREAEILAGADLLYKVYDHGEENVLIPYKDVKYLITHPTN